MAVLVLIMAIFLTSGVEEAIVPLKENYITSNGSVGICSQAACIWK